MSPLGKVPNRRFLHCKLLTQLSQVDKRSAPGFLRLSTAKDKQCSKRDRSRVRRLPKRGNSITKAW